MLLAPFRLTSADSHSQVFEALPVVFVERRNFTYGQLGLVYIGTFRAFVGWRDLKPSRRCLYRPSPGGCNLHLDLEEYEQAREGMGGLPATRGAADRCHDRRAAPGDRLLLARLDRRVQLYPLVCSGALDGCNRLFGKPGIYFVDGESLVLVRGTGAYPVSRAT